MRTLTYALAGILIASLASPSLAGGDGASSPSSVASPTTTEINSVGVNQSSGGIIQVNNGYSNFGTPNCGSGCAYINIRMAPTAGATASGVEATTGIVWQFGSAEAAQSHAIRLTAELQKYKTEQEVIDYLSRQLADALEKNQLDRVRIVAIVLAPKLGFSDYRALLTAVTNGRIKE